MTEWNAPPKATTMGIMGSEDTMGMVMGMATEGTVTVMAMATVMDTAMGTDTVIIMVKIAELHLKHKA